MPEPDQYKKAALMVEFGGRDIDPDDCPPETAAQVLVESRKVFPVSSKEILPAKLWRNMTFSAFVKAARKINPNMPANSRLSIIIRRQIASVRNTYILLCCLVILGIIGTYVSVCLVLLGQILLNESSTVNLTPVLHLLVC
ncbi:MAG: hypothetical protein HRU08_05150 [Oleispira sp.]|nr:hypothetical protein [Oleispira sp.]